jgi:hypothetical protein
MRTIEWEEKGYHSWAIISVPLSNDRFGLNIPKPRLTSKNSTDISFESLETSDVLYKIKGTLVKKHISSIVLSEREQNRRPHCDTDEIRIPSLYTL